MYILKQEIFQIFIIQIMNLMKNQKQKVVLNNFLSESTNHLQDSVEQPLAELGDTLDDDLRFGDNFPTNMEVPNRDFVKSNMSSIEFIDKRIPIIGSSLNLDEEESKVPGYLDLKMEEVKERAPSQGGSSRVISRRLPPIIPSMLFVNHGVEQVSSKDSISIRSTPPENEIPEEPKSNEVVYTQDEKNKLANIIKVFMKSETKKTYELQQQKILEDKAKKFLEVEKTLDGAAFFFKEFDRKFVIYDKKSLGIFKADGWFRRKIVWLICWPWFDNFIIIMIAINSLLLAATDYSDRENLTKWNQAIEASGLIFTVTFTLEAIIKIMAMGFCRHKNSYLRDPWNWLDFLVVCIGIIEFIPALPAANLKALRTFRVLRPLRSINAFPSMRRLIGSLLASLPSLGNAVIFMFFVFLLFGILGVHQFQGLFYQRCRYSPEPNKDPVTGKYTDWPIVEEIERICGLNNQGQFKCPEPYVCGSPIQFSLDLESEKISDQILINYGITTFDNIFQALITIFQMITLEGWTDIMYNLTDSSQAWMAIGFCVLLVVVGSFFLLNVILAVIMDAFDQVDKNTAVDDAKKKFEVRELKKQYSIKDSADEESSEEEKKEPVVDQTVSKQQIQKSIILNLAVKTPRDASSLLQIQQQDSSFKAADSHRGSPLSGSMKKIPVKRMSAFNLLSKDTKNQSFRVVNITPQKQPKKVVDRTVPLRAQTNRLYQKCFIICTHNTFSLGITFCIIINTVLLAMDRHPIEPDYDKRLEFLNSILSWVFFAEMVVKMIGLGIKEYAQDDFNLFDCAVVVTSIIDLFIGMVGADFGGGGAISALRAVRLLRVFKLARSWTSFRELLAKIIVTLKDIRNFSVLMLLFMFIYTLLGMELYAYRVIFNNEDKDEVATSPGEYPRANFNTFLSGFTTIFIVFIGEDWNSYMYDHVRATGISSIFFFISLFILGNLVLLNLFLAILLKNFEEPPGKDEEEVGELKVSILQKTKTIL